MGSPLVAGVDSDALRATARSLAPGADRSAAPVLLPGTVRRHAALTRLDQHPDAACVLVNAPAGYGKTTILATLAELDERPCAWLTLGRADDDAMSLLAHLLLALDEVDRFADQTFEDLLLSEADLVTVRLPRLAEALASHPRPFLLVLDDAHQLHTADAHDILRTVIHHVPPGSRVAIATRVDGGLGVARARASQRIVDVGTEDLAMSVDEGAALLREAGLVLTPDQAAALVDHTEGWPAGLYLCALALRAASPGAVAAFSGSDHLVAEYLRDEILSTTSPELEEFLLRTSILDQMTGPLCDAMLERTDSASVLAELAEANRFVVRVDRRHKWYRYHHLFQDLLRSELERREPDRIAELHLRASQWFEAAGDDNLAIDHAHARADIPRVAELVWRNWFKYVGSGRTPTASRWLEPLDMQQRASEPALALTSAWCSWTSGTGTDVDSWVSVVEHSPRLDEILPDGTPTRAALALLKAQVGRDGLHAVRDDAAQAVELDRTDSPYAAIGWLLAGAASRLLGETEHARTSLERARSLGAIFSASAHAHALGFLAQLAADADRWDEAAALCDRGFEVVDEYGLHERPAMCIFYAGAALAAARTGATVRAREHGKHAAWLLPMLHNHAPWAAAETNILLARTCVLVGEPDEARRIALEAERILATYADAGALPAAVHDVQRQLEASSTPLGLKATPLTAAELRVLAYLPTHLSFADIAEELFVSRNTVKTQAIAVYRKLEVTSRGEAVEQARLLGLIDR